MNSPTPFAGLAVPTIPINAIMASLSNPRKRFDEDYIAELAESIKSHGLIQPITVRPLSLDGLFAFNNRAHPDDERPQYEIVVGECRWRAAKLAGLTDIPGYWRDLDDKQVLEIQVIENLQRRDVHPLEEADGYRSLIDKHGYTADEIGEKIGKSRSYVYARMKLSALGDIGREAFFDGEFDASVALLIARIPDEKDQRSIINALRNQAGTGQPISYRESHWRIRNGFTKDLTIATFKPDDADLLPSAGSCTDCPKRSGNHPELCPDIDSADVCTDTRCFEEKRLARHQQLLDGYSQRQIKVYAGEEAKTIAPHETEWSINSEEWMKPDDKVPEDDRTYSEVLGDAFPTSVVVEVKGHNCTKLIELASVTAIAQAMEKAGFSLGDDNDDEEHNETQPRVAAEPEWKVRQRERDAQVEPEKQRRANLLAAIMNRLIDHDGDLNTDPIITELAIAFLRQEESYNELPRQALEAVGIEFPDPWDEQAMLDVSCNAIRAWPIGKVLAFLTYMFSEDERYDVYDFADEKFYPSHGLNAVAKAIDIDPDIFGEPPASTQAAQAQEPVREEIGGLAIGDRVRIRNDIATGTAAWRRKVGGREGAIETFAEGGAYFDVRIGEGKAGLVKGLTFNEVEKIAPATENGDGNGQADLIETNEKAAA